MTKTHPIHVCILGAGFDTSNLGVSALAHGAVRCITGEYPMARISLLDYGTSPDAYELHIDGRRTHVSLVNMRYSWRVYLPNNIVVLLFLAFLLRVFPSKRLRRSVISRNRILKHIAAVDLFASLAGGDSFSDIYGLARLLYVSLPQILVLMMGRDLVLMPQTIGPFSRRSARMIARYILRRSRLIYARDLRGASDVEALIGADASADRCRFSYDVAFALEPVAPAKTAQSGARSGARPLVGLNISGLLYMGGYSGRNMFGLRGDYRETTRKMVEMFISEKRADILLVPHVMGGSPESDASIAENVYEDLRGVYGDRIQVVRGPLGAEEVKYVIGQCDYFVGARMHACIAAISQCVPALAVAYSDKFIGVMEAVGSASIVADARKLTSAELVRMAAEGYDERAATKALLTGKMPEVKRSVLHLFRFVNQMVESAA